MVTKMHFLEDKRFHSITGAQDFVEICELPLGNEPLSYLVIAKGLVQRIAFGGIEGSMNITIRLDVLSKFSVLLGRDEDTFDLEGVGSAGVITGGFVQFSLGDISRHVSLTVAATVPSKGGAGATATGAPIVIPPPRAILSARGSTSVPSGASFTNVRIVALPADEIVVKTIT